MPPALSFGSAIRSATRTVARWAVGRTFIWNLLPAAARRSTYLQVQRHAALERIFMRRRDRVFADRTVRQGPFAGLRYPDSEEYGSAYFPKLIGSYEAELHARLLALVARKPALVVDVGCAGGYYVAGLGRLLPQARLVGYDLDAGALAACRALARHNGIPDERLALHGAASVESLRAFLPARSLVICDCEGFEAELFAPGTLEVWRQSDLLIECHDFIRPGIAESLRRILAATHDVARIATTDAPDKLPFLEGREFAGFSRDEKLRLLAEGRPAAMEWIVATARTRD